MKWYFDCNIERLIEFGMRYIYRKYAIYDMLWNAASIENYKIIRCVHGQLAINHFALAFPERYESKSWKTEL